MSKKIKFLRILAIFTVILLIALAFHPALNPIWDTIFSHDEKRINVLPSVVTASDTYYQQPKSINEHNIGINIDDLIAATPPENQIDTDEDGLYDSVEAVLGTDSKNSDSDFDRLTDFEEVKEYNTDPLEPDSNNDGLPDYFEVTDVPLDIDNDGYPNAWDNDNDGDKVPDASDLSPFSYSEVRSNFDFNITTTGHPTYIDFQIRPSNSNYLRLAQQTWNWPYDEKGSMKDLDNSEEDVTIIPTLELTIPTDFTISAKHSGKCLEVQNASMEDEANVQQSSYNESEDQQLWTLDFVEEGYYAIIAKHSGKCLEVLDGSTQDGANVQQSTFLYQQNQLWRLEFVSEGYYNIISKQSGKCLEVLNASSDDGENVQQNDYWILDHQLWKFEPVGTYIPSVEDMMDYGIIVNLNKLTIPLSPAYDYGTPVALKGRLFYPSTEYTTSCFNAQLVWKVSGTSDTKVHVLKASNEYNVSVQDEEPYTLLANSSNSTGRDTFEIMDLGNNMVAFRAPNGLYVTVLDDENGLLVANSSSINDQEMFKKTNLGSNNIGLRANNKKYVTLNTDNNTLYADSSAIGTHQTFKVIDVGYKSDIITLASYRENFMLTGFNIQENYGADAALFYSADQNQTLAASFVMAYDFLRNNQTTLSEIRQDILPDNNVTVNSTIHNNITHMDLAILEVTNNMTPPVIEELDNLTDDKILPMIIALEENFTIQTLDEIGYGKYLGDTFTVNLCNLSTAVAKYFKLGWYNTSSKEVLETESFLEEIETWGHAKGFNESSPALNTFMSLMLAWNVGESRIIKIGEEPMGFDNPEGPEVLQIIQDYGIFSVSGLIDIVELVSKTAKGAYKFLKPILKESNKFLRGLQSTYKALNGAKVGKVFKFMGKVATVLLIIDMIITFVIALYSWFSFADDHGWSDFGVFVGWLSYMVIINWAGLYMALVAVGGPVGALIALILAIFDLIFGIGDIIMGWVLDLFTRIDQRSNFNIELVGNPAVIADDIDDNGIDTGDRIEYKCIVGGKVTRTSDGNWGDVCQSYVHPSLTLHVPPNSNWGSTSTLIETINSYPNYRDETYKLGAWVEPQSMINFPITAKLSYSYRVYYDECWWFFGWHCDRESTSGTSITDLTTINFDVMPKDFTDFLSWNALTLLDNDGDRLLNDEELEHTANPWSYDTDGDGLWDGFEVDQGTLPYVSDSDGDGLGDKLELQLHTNPLVVDTDNDSLSDYEEWRGRPITLEYFGNSFIMHVSSNPLLADSDDDGLPDLEEYMKQLNPCSNDTNGNGICDDNESVYPSFGCITNVNFNGKGNSIRVPPDENITSMISYRILGIENPDTGVPENCSLTLELAGTNFSQQIYNGTPTVGTIIENVTTFHINTSFPNGTYLMKYYIQWQHEGSIPPESQRELIGLININASGLGTIIWKCFEGGTDTDKDLIIDVNEMIGWPVTYTDLSGEHTVNTTSDPHAVDTDGDGLSDVWEHNCYTNPTNPRDVDTDHDGLIDPSEIVWGTNPLHYDSDEDGLDDSTEINFRSNPNLVDTDFDGLNDALEFQLNSNPNNIDTDYDELSDYQEYLFGSSLFLPDTDGDMLFDIMEYTLSADPRNPDTDGDGLLDGYEYFYNTDPNNNDTDFDGLDDFAETYWKTNPTLSDTDNDSLNDGDELVYGTHPLIADTDFDTINDSEDYDTYASHVDNIILAYDVDEDVLTFMENLQLYTNITIVSAEELLDNKMYSNASNIVLVGRPDAGEGTVGNITYTILNETGENVSGMIDSDTNRLAVKYGIWNSTQTIVMLTHPYFSDHWIVLNILKGKRQTVTNNSVEVDFPTPRDVFYVDAREHIDASLWVTLNESATPWVKMTRFNTSSTPCLLTHSLGLSSNQQSIHRYLEINVSENIQNETKDIINETGIMIYYTQSDLDRTGDGDIEDIGDIIENTLSLYCFDESTGQWIKLTKSLDWVFDMGVDTTNVELFGTSYEGYIWVRCSHFSLYSIAGVTRKPAESPPGTPSNNPPSADASASEHFGFVNAPVTFNGSLSSDDGTIISYDWDFGDETIGDGELTTHTYSEAGLYTSMLTVTDNYYSKDTDTFIVTIDLGNMPPTQPIITGPYVGEKNNVYNFTIVSSDFDNDSIRYIVNWDDAQQNTSAFFENSTPITLQHSWNTAGIYRIMAYAEDENNAVSNTSNVTIFIDVIIEPIETDIPGYLVDKSLDDIFDVYYNNDDGVERKIQKQSDGTYLIDDDGDGNWDYVYNVDTKSLTTYSEPISSTALVLGIGILALLVLLAIILFRKNEKIKKHEQQKAAAIKKAKKKPQPTKKNKKSK